MREISVLKIKKAVSEMCIEANCILNDDIYNAIKKAKSNEQSPIALNILDELRENANIAKCENIPICQDTGMTVIFVDIGQDVHFTDGLINDAINEGVKEGYESGYLRKSVVNDPFLRVNTKDNTPAIIHYDIVEGDKVNITVAPKGFGSENMSKIFMLKPSQGIEGVKNCIIDTVSLANSNACPPMIIGVGVGGNFEKSAILAKKALLRPIGSHSDKPHIKEMEIELFEKLNNLGIGPQGLGGHTTVLGINIESFPTHIAGMPVAVNISCHVTRHVHRTI